MTGKKDIIGYLLILALILQPLPVYAQEPFLQAQAAVLIDAASGEILYQRNAHKPKAPASTTKIMTALLAIEISPDLQRQVTVSRNAAATGESTIGLEPGDRVALIQLLHGALLPSGNDACVAIAETLTPSEEEFVNLMNLKARALGALNTHFCNTNGLPDDSHVSTAYDLALMARYAMKNQVFCDIVRKKGYTLTWDYPRRKKLVKNTNKLLWSYPKSTGIKTGTTVKAGKCLVASAGENGTEVIAAILNSPDRFGDARRLLEFGLKEIRHGKK